MDGSIMVIDLVRHRQRVCSLIVEVMAEIRGYAPYSGSLASDALG